MYAAGIVIMSKDTPETFDESTIQHLSGIEKMQFIDYILDDYEYVLRKKLHPTLIRYYKDVLARLIKNYGH